MPYTVDQIIILSTLLPVLMAAVTAAINFKTLSQSMRFLCWIIFFSVLIEIVSRVFWFMKASNLFLWPIYVSVSFTMIIWMFSIALESAILNRLRAWIISAFLSLMLFRTWIGANQGLIIDNIGILTESIIIIGLSVAYYLKVFQELKIYSLWQDPFFWVSTGLFLFYSGNFLFFIFLNYILLYSPKLNSQAWVIHALLNYLLYGIYTVALWINRKR